MTVKDFFDFFVEVLKFVILILQCSVYFTYCSKLIFFEGLTLVLVCRGKKPGCNMCLVLHANLYITLL